MIPEFLAADSFDVTVRYTERKGHAAEIAAEAIGRGVDVVVAVGGDGTVNETARALVHSETALGIVPCGSGNGLARHLSMPMNAEGALSVIADCYIRRLDYGLINGQPFFCTAGVGFDAFLSDRFNKCGRRGLRSYIENALVQGLRYKPETYELTVDESREGDGTKASYRAFLITCANASQYGNDFFIAPQASMCDGLMDVTIMEPFSPLEAPQIAYQLVNRTIDRNSKIRSFKCRSLTIRRAQPGVIHYDGDPKDEAAEVSVRMVPGGINMVVNRTERVWQPPLLKAFTDLYLDLKQIHEDIHADLKEMQNGVNEQLRQAPQKISRINKELLSRLRKNRSDGD